MTSVPHLWNVSQFFEKIRNPEVAKLRMHYLQCCRELSDDVELPKQQFGLSVLCPQCGSAWATTKHKTRITPGQTPSTHIENCIRVAHTSGTGLSKYCQTLIRKCERNKANKNIKICSVCSFRAKFTLGKPKRQKIPKAYSLNNSKFSSKKKKKRSKDRTAGLNLSGTPTLFNTPEINSTKGLTDDKHKPPLLLTNDTKNLHKLITPKHQKLNLSKLKGLINTNVTPSRKSKLHAFLQEL